MKKQILFISFLLFSSTVFSQTGNYNRQFGVDATGFVAQFLNFSGSGAGTPSYFFTYRKLGDKQNSRVGIGGNFILSGGDSDTRFITNINARFGKERYKDFAKRWRGFYGWDLKTGLGVNAGGGNEVVSLNLGPSAFFGLLFRLNSRLSLSTETSFDILANGLFREDSNDFSVATFFRPPMALYVNYDFFKNGKAKKTGAK